MKITPFKITFKINLMALFTKIMRQSMPDYQTHLVSSFRLGFLREDMTLTDILIILATALSPVIAVQVTRFLDDRNEERGRKLKVFKTLMATRAYNISPAHIEALNTIDLEFSTKRPIEKAVLDVWQQYLDHLGQAGMEPGAWNIRRVDLLVDLLYSMGTCLGYDFNKTQIKNGTYSPTAHGRIEDEQSRIRAMTLELLEGNRDLPMRVTNLPPQ